MTNIKLKPTEILDLDTLFKFQLDKEGGYLAAFMPKDATDKSAYISKYTKLLSEPTVNNQNQLKIVSYHLDFVNVYLQYKH